MLPLQKYGALQPPYMIQICIMVTVRAMLWVISFPCAATLKTCIMFTLVIIIMLYCWCRVSLSSLSHLLCQDRTFQLTTEFNLSQNSRPRCRTPKSCSSEKRYMHFMELKSQSRCHVADVLVKMNRDKLQTL